VHQQVDAPGYEIKAGVRIERALPVWSDRAASKAKRHAAILRQLN
jgi:hypothetical protein